MRCMDNRFDKALKDYRMRLYYNLVVGRVKLRDKPWFCAKITYVSWLEVLWLDHVTLLLQVLALCNVFSDILKVLEKFELINKVDIERLQ